ncbi:zinc ribbon domain-containing protein [Trueperella sp. LYQ143]|uniref:zinc ribbon domain-containing protein n=1 Tax=unclassified Trueperella TaxID=2630174 RepID=UPI0039835C60
MVRAPRADQLQLLTIVEEDREINHLTSRIEKHPLRAELGQTMNEIARSARNIQSAQEELAAAQSDLAAASEHTARRAQTLAKKNSQLDAGIGMDSRELLALQAEIATNQALLDEANEAEFTAWERVEQIEAEIAQMQQEMARFQDVLLRGRSRLEDEVAQLTDELDDIRSKRDRHLAELDPALQEAYAQAVARGGLAVIAVHPNGDTSGGIQLSPIEMEKIKSADPEEIYFSEDYECIVILLEA